MNFDECALRKSSCSTIIFLIIYPSLCILCSTTTVRRWIYVSQYYLRMRKKTSVPPDNEPAKKKTMHLYLYFLQILYYAFCLSAIILVIVRVMLEHRYNYLTRGEGLTAEQRALVAAVVGPYEFSWQREIAKEEAWLEEQSQTDPELKETLNTTFRNESAGSIIERIAIEVPNQHNQNNLTTLEELAEPNIAPLKTGDEASLLTEEMSDESMERFEQLVGYKVRFYISQKSPSFNVTGNLNFWEYFQLQSQYQDLSHLRRSNPLEDDKTIEDVFFLSDTNPVRLSADNQFLLYDSLIDGPDFEQLTHSHKVTIATQTSMDRLFTFIDSYEHWNGPISVAVFLKGPLEYFLLRSYLSYLKLCHPKHYRQTRFSIATPIKNPIPRNILIETETFEKFDCKSRSDDINVVFKKELEETNNWLQVNYYPQNMMRNLARANIKTDYHLTLDVDTVPCVGMSEKLNKFLNGSFIASALVIPTYEISRKISFPQTKRELVSLTKKKLAQPFHRDVFATNQNATNFPKWEKVHDSFEDVHVVHEIQLFPIFYEPFFVELQSNPLFDETFVGYGFTRSSHAFEVFVKNGKFLVLSPIFTAELGIKKVKDWSTSRQQQNENNRRRFNNFIANITSQYPDVQKVENASSTSYHLHNSGN